MQAATIIVLLDERLDGLRDAAEGTLRHFADRDRVRPRLIANRIDVDSDADHEERAIVLNSRFDQDAGDLAAIDQDVVGPFDARVDRKYVT